jgi:hypothetical protein
VSADDVVVRPRDPLDVVEARRLVREVEGLPAEIRIELDVSALRELHPAGLAYLAYALARDGRVFLRGLDRRHERLLAYLLADAGQGPDAPAAAPEASAEPPLVTT